jgi:hypothetical protein
MQSEEDEALEKSENIEMNSPPPGGVLIKCKSDRIEPYDGL